MTIQQKLQEDIIKLWFSWAQIKLIKKVQKFNKYLFKDKTLIHFKQLLIVLDLALITLQKDSLTFAKNKNFCKIITKLNFNNYAFR